MEEGTFILDPKESLLLLFIFTLTLRFLKENYILASATAREYEIINYPCEIEVGDSSEHLDKDRSRNVCMMAQMLREDFC